MIGLISALLVVYVAAAGVGAFLAYVHNRRN